MHAQWVVICIILMYVRMYEEGTPFVHVGEHCDPCFILQGVVIYRHELHRQQRGVYSSSSLI